MSNSSLADIFDGKSGCPDGVLFGGDYYRFEEDVSRGLFLSDLALDNASSSGCQQPFIGDYFREEDDVVRSACLSGPTCDDTRRDVKGDGLAFRFEHHLAHRGFGDNHASNHMTGINWQEAIEAPWGGVARTSILVPVESASSSEVMNAIYQYMLQQPYTFRIVKVRPGKLSITAVARIQRLGACCFKARLFLVPQQKAHAVELSRKAESAVAFGELLQRIASFVSGRFSSARAMNGGSLPATGDRMASPPPPPAASGNRTEEDYAPLMEMATGSEIRETRAEAIAALAAAAALPCPAAAACLRALLADRDLKSLLRDERRHAEASAKLLATELPASSARSD